jgi:hypothetical protein
MQAGFLGTAGVILILALLHSERTREATATPVSSDSLMGVFEGRTPCGQIAVAFTGFPSQNCEKIKWQLTLYRDASSGRPTTFLYEGTRTTRRGTWTTRRGSASDPNARVYQLAPASSGEPLFLLSVEDNVLLLLDPQLRVMVGDASWSYALNRTDRHSDR